MKLLNCLLDFFHNKKDVPNEANPMIKGTGRTSLSGTINPSTVAPMLPIPTNSSTVDNLLVRVYLRADSYKSESVSRFKTFSKPLRS